MKHPTYIIDYNGTFEQLAFELNQDYSQTLSFIEHLATDFYLQSRNDFENGRKKLSKTLADISRTLYIASLENNYQNECLEVLTRDVGNMQYDCVAKFIDALAENLVHKADLDLKNEEKKIASEKYFVADYLFRARDELEKAWKICQPYMS